MIKAIIYSNLKNRNYFKEKIRYYNENSDFNIKIYEFNSKDMLYSSLCKESFDIIFLQDENENKEIARYIRKNLNNKTDMAVITSVFNISVEWLKFRVFDYLNDTYDYTDLYNCLKELEFDHDFIPDYFRAKVGRTVRRLLVNDILYIHCQNRKLFIHTKSEIIPILGKLSDFQDQKCFRHFILCHCSYLVNPIYINFYCHNKLLLLDNTSIPVSRSKAKNLSCFKEVPHKDCDHDAQLIFHRVV